MQEIYSKLSEDEQKILQLYHQRSKNQTVTDSKDKLKKFQETNENLPQTTTHRNEPPARVLKTKIFNDSQKSIKSQIPSLPTKPRSSTPKRKRKSSLKTILNSSSHSKKLKNSSRTSSSSKLNPYRRSSAAKILDITKLPNWRYEINKLVRTVFRHSVLCPNFREESQRIGGLKILDEYRKYNNT